MYKKLLFRMPTDMSCNKFCVLKCFLIIIKKWCQPVRGIRIKLLIKAITEMDKMLQQLNAQKKNGGCLVKTAPANPPIP